MKKYDFSMKKYDFLPSRPPFLQDFCKKAQWRAKKLRERGSNTARPTEKGGGGLPIGARPVDFGASIRSRPVDFVAIGGLPLGVSVDSVASRRFGASIVTDTDTDTEGKTQKSPIPQSGDRAQLSQGVALGELPFGVVSSQGVARS